MTNINMFNNIFSPTANTQNPAAAGASAGSSAASSGAPEAAANTGLSAADELMQQLIDDSSRTNSQTPTATVLQALREEYSYNSWFCFKSS